MFYENLILFLGAFLVFAGSIYFAAYFWDRLGQFGPLVAGGLLAVYGLVFAAVGYLLQRRYHAELSARVLYGVATAILPVASTLLGEPIRTAGVGAGILAACLVGGLGAITYLAIFTAASLFQREIGKPFARSFVALLCAIGLAPLVTVSGIRFLGILYVYLAAVPVLAMYRRVREVGRVFERATVVYVVGGSAYLVLGVAARTSLAMSPTLAPAEVAPLLVLIATAAIDLDVAWRQQSRAVRSTLGAIGVLAHSAAVLAIVIAAADPIWRVLTTLSAGLVFAVTALRHRRSSAVHLAIVTVAAGALLVVWMPVLAPPHGVAFGGLLLLALSAGLARLGARWRRNAALEFATPCELWATLCPIIAVIPALLPLIGSEWRLAELGRWSTYVPALVVLPSSSAVLALAWSWSRRRHYLAISAVAAASAVLVVVRMAGAQGLGLALTSAGLSLVIAGGAALRLRNAAAGASEALLDAALVLLTTTIVLSVAWVGPWHGAGAATSVLSFVLLACAAVAVASQRPRREVGLVAVLGMTAAAAAGLWIIAPPEIIPGILAVALLGLDRTKAHIAIGRAQPLRDAYAVALAAVVLQVIQISANTTTLESISPLGSSLVALALLAIAARQRSPWPTYGAVGFLLAAAYGSSAALDLAMGPRTAVKGAGLAVMAIAVGLRGWPRLRPWRPIFLDIPLHLAVAVAPLSLCHFLLSFGLWEANEAPRTYLLLRRLAPPLGLSVLAAITHGSRAHAYLAVASSMFVLPAVVASLGLGSGAVAPALAAAGVIALIGVYDVARRPAFAEPVQQGDLPLHLFGLWQLPSAATRRDLWLSPIHQLGLLTALLAGGMSVQRSIASWPVGSTTSALVYLLLAAYSVTRCIKPIIGDRRQTPLLAAHATCAAMVLLCTEVTHLLGHHPRGAGLVLVGTGFLLLGEALARRQHPAARPGARAAQEWAIGLLVIPITLLVRPTHATTPSAAAILAVAVIRYSQRYLPAGVRIAGSIATMAAVGFLVLWVLGQVEWLMPAGVAISALAVAAAIGAWAHWFARARAHLGEPFHLVSGWSLAGCLLAVASGWFEAPASAPAVLPTTLAIATLVLATVWFTCAAVRTAEHKYGYAAQTMLLLLYVRLRTSPLGAGLSSDTDIIVAIGSAFAMHFLSELLQRARLTALERPAIFGARFFPVGACAIALWIAISGQGDLPTLRHAVLAATLGILYTLGFRRGGHRARALGVVALCFYNLGLAWLWLCTGRQDALYYTVPVGISIILLARIYRSNMSRSARRELRSLGSLLIYGSTYYQVVQFDQGLYALLLGGFALAGIVLGFLLQLRELFVLSIGFLVLDVISNLAYHGVHHPVLGWMLLTAAGLCLTGSGIVFQLRRAQVRGFVAGLRTTLAEWD